MDKRIQALVLALGLAGSGAAFADDKNEVHVSGQTAHVDVSSGTVSGAGGGNSSGGSHSGPRDPHNPNPNHDPDVQRGYDEHQRSHGR